MQILWRMVTRFHDWNDYSFPIRLIGGAAVAATLGPATWVITRENAAAREVDVGGPEMAARLMALVRRHGKTLYLEAGGDGWDLMLVVPPFAKATNRLNGLGVIVLKFDRPALEQEAGSRQLWNGFRATHRPADTEFACIHPNDRWHELRRTAYNPAVTYDPMFAGATWANFLGPGHIEQFDRAKLDGVEAEWIDGGVFFRDPAPLADAASPAAEFRMLAVTNAFRHARLP